MSNGLWNIGIWITELPVYWCSVPIKEFSSLYNFFGGEQLFITEKAKHARFGQIGILRSKKVLMLPAIYVHYSI